MTQTPDPSRFPDVSFMVENLRYDAWSWEGREAMNELFRFEVAFSVDHLAEDVAPGAVGALAIKPRHGRGHRRAGLVERIDLKTVVEHDPSGPKRDVRVVLRPAAWRLTQRLNTRIFQDTSIREVVSTLLEEHRVPYRWRAEGLERVGAYVVQYEETDWAFLRRLLAEAGAFFYFRPVEDAVDELVIGSAAHHYGPPDKEDEPVLWFSPASLSEGADPRATFSEVTLRMRTNPPRVVARGFDHRQPTRIIEREGRGSPERDTDSFAGEHFIHHAPFDDDVDGSLARMADTQLEQHRRDATVATILSNAPGMVPGHRVVLGGHPDSGLNRRWVVVRTDLSLPPYSDTARADTARLDTARADTARSGPVRSGEFSLQAQLVPDDVPYRAEIPPRRVVQVAESATVVGPADSPIHTDELGRVCVRFHWDRRSKSPEHASCWVRPLQQWTGPHYGAQYIPRIGAEVAIGFLGGDPDRPFLLGELRNPIQPPPFPLPQAKTRSGWRTQSVGGQGGHELSFEDASGQEEIYVASAGALREHVRTSHLTEVEGDRSSTVRGSTHQVFHGPVVRDFAAPAVDTYRFDRTTQLEQNDELVVAGNRQADVQGHFRTAVGGRVDIQVEGESELRLAENHLLQSEGGVSVLVGSADAPRSIDLDATGAASIVGRDAVSMQSTQEISLRVGESELSITPHAIRLRASAVHLETEGAHVTLDEGLVAAGETLSIKGARCHGC
ncbi:MAG: type VI secretion system tip protein TssI/VgrG [Myxococcota bacterium]